MFIAQDLQNYFLAGLQIAGQNDNGEIEWVGEDKNWKMYQWLSDGAYADKTLEEKKLIISNFKRNSREYYENI